VIESFLLLQPASSVTMDIAIAVPYTVCFTGKPFLSASSFGLLWPEEYGLHQHGRTTTSCRDYSRMSNLLPASVDADKC
jgi:hypothetical protein